jgi:signal transduction histidine kinase
VKEAVTLHKGHIEVQSEVNKFTEFSITIPIIN